MVPDESDSRETARSRYGEQSPGVADTLFRRPNPEIGHSYTSGPGCVHRSSTGRSPRDFADMGAGSAKITHTWFDTMYPDVARARIVFTVIGVVTADPGSVESVLTWADRLQHRVRYLIVENSITAKTDFTYWRASREAQLFQKVFQPAVIQMDYRLPELENATRNYGVSLGEVAAKTTNVLELKRASLVMRAQSYRRRMFAEFEKAKALLLP